MARHRRRTLAAVVLAALLAAGAPAQATAAGSPADGTRPAARADQPRGGDLAARLAAVPGMRVTEERELDTGHLFLKLTYRQPVDHRRPHGATFAQRLTILHRGEDRPTVFYTSGYGVPEEPFRTEPTRLVDGNQVSLEHRFFTPSRPEPADWTKLDIWQAAMDQHRLYRALREVYPHRWIATGASKGGMTATYYRRFFPEDMAGTVAYVAPNDVVDDEDRAYDRFFDRVATAACRDRLAAVQREALLRREELVDRYTRWAEENDRTFAVLGSPDRAFEATVVSLVWSFWQYLTEAECAEVPEPSASTAELYDFVDQVGGLSFVTDQELTYYAPYYYQAATQLGSPTLTLRHLDGLLRHPDLQAPRSSLPREIAVPPFQDGVMADVDRWVRRHGSRLLFVYGENDPWRAEPFRPGPGRDNHVFTAPGANHGAVIESLTADDRRTAVSRLLEWAGVADEADGAAPLAAYDPLLDRPERRGGPVGMP